MQFTCLISKNIIKIHFFFQHAISNRNNGPPVDHWLDRAEPEYGAKLVSDVKAVLKVLVIYIPLPIFWALYDQQGSGWTFQAVRMNGNIGFYTILPDQVQVGRKRCDVYCSQKNNRIIMVFFRLLIRC